MKTPEAAVGWLFVSLLIFVFASTMWGQQKGKASNMDLVGYNDLQGRGAYMPVIQKQGDRWIAYVGHRIGAPTRLNTLTGQIEPSGTSVIDVTNPKHPQYIAHIPGELVNGAANGAQYVRACSGTDLPHADKSKFYLLRNFGRSAWELWDVTDPTKPNRLNVIVRGLKATNNAWWECDTGIAYLGGGPLDWLSASMGEDRHDAISHATIYDLSNPAKPVFVRSFGLPGQEPGSGVPRPVSGLHGVVSTGPKGNRVYFSNGDAGDGIEEIVDREKLLNGPKEPTDENLRYPIVARIDLPPDAGADMSFPLLKVKLPEFAKQEDGFLKDFLAVIGEGHANLYECQDARQMMRIFDITTESKPVGVSTWTVPEANGNFCSGGYFGTHSSNESFTPIYYNRVLFIAHHNAGVRAVDVRDPYHPAEIGYYIPAPNENTQKYCIGEGGERHCKVAIDTYNLEVDDRGLIYIVDSPGTGMHILELAGQAHKVADFNKAVGSRSWQ
jgi:hypothetical protein